MKDNKLEIGDELYYTGNSGGMFYEGKIDRVTKTMAFKGMARYKIEMRGSSGDAHTEHPGDFSYGSKFYYLLTDDKKVEMAKQQARRELERAFITRFEKNLYEATRRLTDSQLSRIIEILKEDTNDAT
jgi:hypothetical protein